MPIIQSVERALRILDLFDEHTTELKITEISSRMALNKSTVHSLLKTLQMHGYIDQDTETGKYKLGMKLFERGNVVIHSLDLRSIARKHLVNLSNETGHTLHLVVLSGKEGVYIDKVEGISATIVYSRIGRRIPLHSSGVGKALIAYKREHELHDILKGYEYIQQTEKTITNEEDFRKELANVRNNGFAVDNEENEPGVCCVAVPIYDHLGEVAAAISLSMPTPRATEEERSEVITRLKEAAMKISNELGYNKVAL
ncbi:IclR family transcriptional regulator [Bacillus taeanensis]|uniref:Glycerol operon regulatory protein n=1 Tax=Bacillus taeanensis TaxID=273032 RepID=A0A366Y436_9BACI|nr:IclR family transcriptional regulator [Bacillus taeanensis]RBW70951.1 IclR family transcriptional regulator [Bacillus taeanensis]